MEIGLEGMRFPVHKLGEIDENAPANWMKEASVPSPETPTESMEFLARSWSVSATELSKALSATHTLPKNLERKMFDFFDDDLQVENHMMTKEYGEHQSGDRPPVSPRESEGTKELFLLHHALHPEFLTNQQLLKDGVYRSTVKGKTMGKRAKDQKERKKQEMITHSAQLHAAISVACVAAAVAALMSSNAMLEETTDGHRQQRKQHKGPPKTPTAIASASALVASNCIEIAEEMGARHDRILAAVNSAINARTNGDIMTLTAAAATALRGASTLKARLQKGYGTAALALEEQAEESKHLNCMTPLNFVMRGGELLKRTRKGDLHWKQVSFSINSTFQVTLEHVLRAKPDVEPMFMVVVKLKSRHMAGAFIKKKKLIVSGVNSEIPAWLGGEPEDDAEQRDYFGIQTADRVIEFECENKYEKQRWIDGIHHLLHCRASIPFP